MVKLYPISRKCYHLVSSRGTFYIFRIEADPSLFSMRVEANDDEDSDDDIEIGAATADFKCALTMSDLKDAMTSYVFILSMSLEFVSTSSLHY